MMNEENASYIVIKAHDKWEYVIKEKHYLIIDAGHVIFVSLGDVG